MKKVLLSIISIFFCLGALVGGGLLLTGCDSPSSSQTQPLEPGGGFEESQNDNDAENDENSDDGIDDYAVKVRRATLIFNANGGSGAPSSMSGTAPNTGDIGGAWSVKFTIPTTVPTRSGYDFVKWSRNSDGSGASYSPGGTIYVGGSTSELIASTTLYAIWEEEVTPYSTFRYSITINGSGGGRVSVWSDYDAATTLIASGSGSVEGRYCAVQASANSGYKASVTGVRYYYFNSSGSITYSSSVPSSTNGGRSGSFSFSVTFTRLSYTLSYNGNGSTGGSTSSHSGVTLTVKSCGFTKTGYSFTYWTASSSGGTRYDPGDSITLTKNTTLYAQWEKDIVYYTVSYSSGSSSASGSVSSQQVESGGSVVVKNNGFSRTGYSFAYWTWNGNIYYPGNTMSNITSDRTLTASWSRRSYTNRYYFRDTSGNQDYDDQTRSYGSTFYMYDTSDISEYTSYGWTLDGWATTSSSTTSSYSPGQSRSSTSTSTLSYYAISRRTVYLSYDSNGGSSVSSTTGTQYWNQYGGNKTNPSLTVTSTTPTRTGFTFQGWATSSSASSASYSAGGSYTFSNSYNSSSSVTLYAVWSRNSYTNRYYYRNSSGGQDSTTQTRYYNSNYTLLSSISDDYESNGWSLYAWGSSSSATSGSSPGSTTSSTSTSTKSYYAISKRSVSISFSANGGKFSSTPSSSSGTQYWNQYGNAYSNPRLSITSAVPTRTGYEFLGWSTSSTATSAGYVYGSTYTFSNGYSSSATKTLYAVWEAKNPAYYDSEGGYWYVENGKLPQSKVSESLKTTLSGQWSSLSDGSVYYMGVEELANSEFASDGGMQSKRYNGNEYVKFNGEFYLVEPIRWRLVYSSSQKEGYAVENTSVLATMAEIVFLGSYSSAKIGAGEGYSAESVTMLLKNQVSVDYLVSESREVEIFGAPKDTTTVSGSVFVASKEELASFTTSKNNTTGSGVKTGKVSLSDFVKDYLRATGQGDYYFTRDLGDQLNTIRCLNPVGNRSQAKAQQTLGVQFTIKVTEYACISA